MSNPFCNTCVVGTPFISFLHMNKSQYFRQDTFGCFSLFWSFSLSHYLCFFSLAQAQAPICVAWASAFCQRWSVANTLPSSLIRHQRICPQSDTHRLWGGWGGRTAQWDFAYIFFLLLRPRMTKSSVLLWSDTRECVHNRTHTVCHLWGGTEQWNFSYIFYLLPRMTNSADENFGTSGSKIALFVSEIWPFEVGICDRAHFTMQNLGSVKGP